MRNTTGEKIRATFYIDKRLYQLLKRCSAVEQIPMSSIINDEILENKLRMYGYDSETAWDHEKHDIFEAEENNQRDLEYEHYAKSAEGRYATAIAYINTQKENGKITENEAQDQVRKAKETLEKAILREDEELKNNKKAREERWKQAILDFPID